MSAKEASIKNNPFILIQENMNMKELSYLRTMQQKIDEINALKKELDEMRGREKRWSDKHQQKDSEIEHLKHSLKRAELDRDAVDEESRIQKRECLEMQYRFKKEKADKDEQRQRMYNVLKKMYDVLRAQQHQMRGHDGLSHDRRGMLLDRAFL